MKSLSVMLLFVLCALGAVCLYAYAGEGSSGTSPPVVQMAKADTPEAIETGILAGAKGQIDERDKGRENWLITTKPARNHTTDCKVNLHNKEDPAQGLTVAMRIFTPDVNYGLRV